MKWLKRLFWDEIKADYLFDNHFHIKWWTSKSWVNKKLSNHEIWKQETEWLKRKNYTSCMRIRRNEIEILNNP